MKATLEYKNAIEEVNLKIAGMKDHVDKAGNDFLAVCGGILEAGVQRLVPRSHEDYIQKNYDGTTPYIHIIDDTKSNVRVSKEGQKYVSVGGGFYTGYKWQWVDGGFTDRKGVFHSGNHFMEKTVEGSMPAIDKYLEMLSNEVIND